MDGPIYASSAADWFLMAFQVNWFALAFKAMLFLAAVHYFMVAWNWWRAASASGALMPRAWAAARK